MAKIESANVGLYIDELRHAVTAASINYDVWWTFKSKENREQYTDTMNTYIGFFSAAINAHFVALLIPLYRLYENKTSTYNIPELLEYLREDERLPIGVMKELDGLRAQAEPLWKKVNVLRNRAFGHRSRGHTTKELFKEARIKPDDFKVLIALTKQVLNTLSQAVQHDTHAFDVDTTRDTVRLLADLKRLHSTNC